MEWIRGGLGRVASGRPGLGRAGLEQAEKGGLEASSLGWAWVGRVAADRTMYKDPGSTQSDPKASREQSEHNESDPNCLHET